ncbi:MAG: DUF167 domain-containing protein [Bacillota bacterium]
MTQLDLLGDVATEQAAATDQPAAGAGCPAGQQAADQPGSGPSMARGDQAQRRMMTACDEGGRDGRRESPAHGPHTGGRGVQGTRASPRPLAGGGGQADEAYRCLLAEILDVPAERVEIIRGRTARDKAVLVHGLTPGQVADRLKECLHK